MKIFDDVDDVFLDFEILSLDCKVGQVLTDSKTTGDEQGVPIPSFEFLERLDVTTGNSRGLYHDVSLVILDVFAIEVINHVHLVSIGSEALNARHLLAEGDEQRGCLGHFGAVLAATSV